MINYTALRLYCYYGFLLAPLTVSGKIYDLGAVKVFQHLGESTVRTSVPVFILHPATIFYLSRNICLPTGTLYTMSPHFAILIIATSQFIFQRHRILPLLRRLPCLPYIFPHIPSRLLSFYIPRCHCRNVCGYIFRASYNPCRTSHTG